MTEHHTQTALAHSINQLPELPGRITLRDGRVVDVSGYVWRMNLGADLVPPTTFYWGQLLEVTARETSLPVMSERAIRLVMLFTAQKLSKDESKSPIKPDSAKNYMRAAIYLTRWLAAHPEWLPSGRGFEWWDMTEDLFGAWLTSLYGANRKGHDAILVRKFYRWGVKKLLPDFSEPLSSALDALNIKGLPVGEVIESRDPKRGAFTSEEMDLILAACRSGKGTNRDRAITWTLLDTAIRPEQMFHLKNRDLILRGEDYEDCEADALTVNHKYWIKVRLLKQRNPKPRYVELPLSEACFRLLWDLRKDEVNPEGRLFAWLRGDFCPHINKRLKAFFKAADLRSPRLPVENPPTGTPLYELMPVNPRRFRYGMATERIALGETEGNVAHALCHTSTGSVRVYTKTSASIADDFQQATDYAILPLIRRMEGYHDDSEGRIQPLSKIASGASSPRKGTPFMNGKARMQFERRRAAERTVLSANADEAAARTAEMVAAARRRFPQLYPGQRFDAQVWDVRHRAERPNATTLTSFGFTTLESTRHKISRHRRDALPPYFANVIKSWLVLDGPISMSGDALRLNAARHLWNFISGRVVAGEFFRWSSLTENDFLAFEYHLRAYESTVKGEPLGADTILRIISQVRRLVYFLAGRGICHEIDYVPQTVSKRAVSTQSLRGKELAAEQKLPAPGTLEALANIYYRLSTAPAGDVSDYTLILISGVVILMFTGMRLGELLTLPFDCEVEEHVPAREPGEADVRYYGLRYWVEKGRKKMRRVKWISPTAEPVVREAVRRIKRLTADARRRAKILEDNPDEVPLPTDIANLPIISRSQLISLLGYKDGSHLSRTSRARLPRDEVNGRVYYRVEDVKAFLVSKRVRELYTFRCGDTVQMLSESLFVVFDNQAAFRQTNKCSLLVEPVKGWSIEHFLSPAMGRNGPRLTVFAEFGLTEEEKALIMNPHAFRHWLIHIAYQGGIPGHLALRYFEKQFDSDIVDYIHFMPEETNPYMPDELRPGYASV
jgi:integrase